MPEEVFVLTMFALVATVGILLAVIMGPIGRAFGRKVEGRNFAEGDVQGLREDLQASHAELADLRREMGELQERMDFAERLLAARPDQAGLPAGRMRGER